MYHLEDAAAISLTMLFFRWMLMDEVWTQQDNSGPSCANLELHGDIKEPNEVSLMRIMKFDHQSLVQIFFAATVVFQRELNKQHLLNFAYLPIMIDFIKFWTIKSKIGI